MDEIELLLFIQDKKNATHLQSLKVPSMHLQFVEL